MIAYLLIKITLTAKIIAPKKSKNKLKVKWIVPGLETIKTPTKPTITAIILLGPIFSFKIKNESAVIINGALKSIGYISLNAWFLKELMIIAAHISPRTPLNNWICILLLI